MHKLPVYYNIDCPVQQTNQFETHISPRVGLMREKQFVTWDTQSHTQCKNLLLGRHKVIHNATICYLGHTKSYSMQQFCSADI